MAFCKACGQEIGDAGFCPKCGAAQGATAGGAAVAVTSTDSPTAGIDENVAGLLCYLFGWVSGLIFLLIDKRSFVKFHAAQAIAFNVAIVGVWIAFVFVGFIFSMILAAMHFPLAFFGLFLWPLVGLCIFLTWIFLMYKAFKHEKYKLPIIGNLVEGMIK
jgi:uncharacterized membrane protein